MKNKLFFFLISCVCSLFGKEQTDILFYLQDAGETNALLPVIRKLNEKGVDCRILVAGVAEELAMKSGIPKELFLHFNDLKIEAQIDRNWGRSETLSQTDIALLLDEIEPKEVVAGVAYELQGQIMEGYAKRNIPTFAYWDNFNADGENPYFQTAHHVEAKARTLLLPSFALEKAFEQRKGKKVVGQPTLQEWNSQIAGVDCDALRQKLGIKPAQKVALFIGGYGNEYEEAFRLFLKGIPQSDQIFFLIQPHPKTKGSFERAARRICFILEGELTTIEAVALADVVICHQSTVAFQALGAGKPVVHVIPPSQHYESLPLQKGLAKRIDRPENLAPAIEEAMQRKIGGFFELLQIPENSVDLFISTLLDDL